MKPLHRRRVLHAAQSLSSAADRQRTRGRQTDRETDDDAEEFVKVEEIQTDDEDDVDEDFHAMTNAMRLNTNGSNRSGSSAACGTTAQMHGNAFTSSKVVLSLSPANSQDATEDTSMECTDIEPAAIANALVVKPPRHSEAEAKLLVSGTVAAAKRTAKGANQRTSASQKESAARLTASAYAGRIASPNQAGPQQTTNAVPAGRTSHNKHVPQRRISSISSTSSTRFRPTAASGARRSAESSCVVSVSLRHSEAEAKLLVSDTVTAAKRKLRSMSYKTTAQDPRTLLRQYDRNKSGELDWTEFKSAVRKGGRVGVADVAEDVLRQLFDAVDRDGSGSVSIEELTAFVWGNQNRLKSDGVSLTRTSDRAAPSADQLENIGGGELLLPSKAERDLAFQRMDVNGNGALSLAEIDKAIVEIWPQFNHKKSIMRAYKAADVDSSGYIGRREFGLLLKYLVYFDQMWDK